MSDNINSCGEFKEAVCVNVGRIYDSCSDKDCLEYLRVYFTECGQSIVDNSISVKVKGAQLLQCFTDVDNVPFNKGFYSVDMTFFFKVMVECYNSPTGAPIHVHGLATHSKKVILYGSEGSVKTFTSTDTYQSAVERNRQISMPKATVSVVDPICLGYKVTDSCEMTEVNVTAPACVAACFDGEFTTVVPTRAVYVTLGLFSIVHLERNVQMLIPAYDFCIPDKECTNTTDDPCELFRRIKFPTNEFFPPRLSEGDCGCGD